MPGSGVQPPTVKWQVMYISNGIEYWWDYPADVSARLEQAPTRSLEWTWTLPGCAYGSGLGPACHGCGRSNQYSLCPGDKIQYNTRTGSKRKMRRIVVIS